MAFDAAGLVLGPDTRLAWLVRSESNRASASEPERFMGLLTVALGQRPSVRSLSAIESGLAAWQAGDAALANLHLVFSGLPQLDAPQDMQRLKAAEILFDAGLTVADAAAVLESDAPHGRRMEKDVSNEPRVPAGNGKKSGEWASRIWSAFAAWLDEKVPVYDQDTGIEVGTQSRARGIVTSPLAVGIAGTAALLGGEALVPAAAATAVADAPVAIAPVVADTPTAMVPIAEEAEALPAFAQRYLSTSGGRLGNKATRQQLYEIAQSYARTGKYTSLQGDGFGPEEFLASQDGFSSTYVDFTAKDMQGNIVRIQTVDTLADGITPTVREAAASARIRAVRPSDILIEIPKVRP